MAQHALPKRHSAQLIDQLWTTPMPDEPGVDAGKLRHLLQAMASFTNPTRDQRFGVTRTWQCHPSRFTLAEMIIVNERQVRRMLEVLQGCGYIEEVIEGRGRGRPRRTDRREPGARHWALRPDLWPAQERKSGTGAEYSLRPVTAESQAPQNGVYVAPVARKSGTGDQINAEKVAPVPNLSSEKSGTGATLTLSTLKNPKETEPVKEPALRAKFPDGVTQQSLPGTLTSVPPRPEPPKRRCIKCNAFETDAAAPSCGNKAWHIQPQDVAVHAG